VERHVLVVLPHPDDETFGSAGTIAHFTRAGVPVTYACGTLGQMGRHMGRPLFANRETLPKIREQELVDACDILGIQDVRQLGLRDKTIEFEDKSELANRILALIHEVNPSLIITHYPGHGVHPDHDGLGAATILAVSRMPKAERPVVYCHAITRNRLEALGQPDIIEDISDVLDVKMDAIRAHRSQSAGVLAQIERRFKGNEAEQGELEQFRRQEVYWIYKFEDEDSGR